MDTTLFNRIVDLLTPHMEEGDRRTLLTPAFSGYPIFDKIDWTGAAREFTVRLIELLDRYGEIEPGYLALAHLLQAVHPQVGWQDRRKIDILQEKLNSTNIQAPKAKEDNSMPPLRVFLCHASDDKEEVRNLYKRLELDGLDPWLDEQKLLPGQDWQQEIPQAVRQADVVLVALSHNAINAGGYIREEISFALDTANKLPAGTIYIIPVKLEECDVPQQLARWQWVDLSQANGYERLIKALQSRAHGTNAQIPVWQSGPYESVTTSTPKSITERPKQESPPWFWLIIIFGIVLAMSNYLYRKGSGVTPTATVEVPSSKLTHKKFPISSLTTNPTPTIGEPYINSIDNATYLPIPAGEFIMGSSDEQVDYAMELCNAYGSDECLRDWFADEQPQLHIYLDNYWIMKTEVTNAQYRKFMEAGGYSTEEYWHPDAWIWREGWIEPGCWKDSKFKGDQHPVVCISWYKADAYTKWLSAQTGLDFGLPTEAEWEKAARGIEGFHFPWGNHWDESRLNHCKRCINQWDDKNVDSNYKPTDPVDSYQIGDSPYGMLNMAGNVWEWTTSWYDSKYHSNMSNQNPKNLENGNERVLRGGGWLSELYKMRTTYRVKLHPSGRFNDVGFRVRLSGNEQLFYYHLNH